MAQGGQQDGRAEPHPELSEALRRMRRERAARDGVPAYVVFPDTTLEAIAASRPRTPEELLATPGIGPSRQARYGEEVLSVARAHLDPR